MFDDSKIDRFIPQWQEPTTVWDGKPVLGFMAETFLDDLSVIGFKDFNPMWTFPTTSVNQCWDPMTFGMPPWHVGEDADINKQKSKEALQSQSPIAAFKACNMLQALGIAYSKNVLPSGDSKREAKHRTHCPTTWSHCYQWAYAAQYADQLRQANASPLLCKECTLLARIQLSKKSPNHPDCAFADCASTTMCGAMISLTPCMAPTVERECDLDASVSFTDASDMIQQLSAILRIPRDFPQTPAPRKDCHVFHAKPDERHKQMVICPEQDCEWLAYMSDLDTCMVEALGVQDHSLWRERESRCSKNGSRRATKAPSPSRKHGHGKEAALPSGPLLLHMDLPSVASLFLLTSLSAQIQRKRVSNGENSMCSTPASNSSSRRLRFHVQLTSPSTCFQSSKRCTSIGSCDDSILIVSLTRIHGFIVHTAT